MNPLFKIIFRKFSFILTIFLVISAIFIFVNNFLLNKLKLATEEQSNLTKLINEGVQSNLIVDKLRSEVKKIEEKYNINIIELKSQLKSKISTPDNEVKNQIISLAKEQNLSLNDESEENPKIFRFSLTGSFDDLRKFENILRENKIKAKINSVRIFSQPDNKYLFQLEIIVL